MKTILKQERNSIQRQDIVTFSNLKSRKIKILLSFPIHLPHHRFAAAAVAPLLLLSLLLFLRCRSYYHSCCRSDVAPGVAPLPLLSLRYRCCCSCYLSCCHSTVTPAVATLSLRYCSVISPLSLRCCSAAAAVTPAVTWISHGSCLKRQTQGNGFHQWLSGACVFLPIAEFYIVENSQGGNLITLYSSMSDHILVCGSILLWQRSFCCSTVTPSVTPLLLLMSLGLLTAVASRGSIRVSVSICVCPARVSSCL